jgi:hypothetical protein
LCVYYELFIPYMLWSGTWRKNSHVHAASVAGRFSFSLTNIVLRYTTEIKMHTGNYIYCTGTSSQVDFLGRPKFVVRTKHEIRYRNAHLYLVGFKFDHQNVYNVITTCMFSLIIRRNLGHRHLSCWYRLLDSLRGTASCILMCLWCVEDNCSVIWCVFCFWKGIGAYALTLMCIAMYIVFTPNVLAGPELWIPKFGCMCMSHDMCQVMRKIPCSNGL